MTYKGIELGGIQIGTNPQSGQPKEIDQKTPFHILILADLSASGNKNKPLKPLEVDRDNFDEIFSKLSPALNIKLKNSDSIDFSFAFNSMEDFEPDAIFDRYQGFKALRRLRRRLSNRDTFSSAASEIQGLATQAVEAPDSLEQPASSDNLLGSLISETEQRQSSAKISGGSDIAQSIIKDIVAPYVIPAADPKQAEYVSAVDTSIGELMNCVLHHPAYQALEASWRSLYLLIKRIKTDSKLKLFVLDISKSKLDEMLSTGDVEQTPFYKQFIEPAVSVAGSKPWSVILGDFEIQDQAVDILLLQKLGECARASNATFVSAASPNLAGCENLATTPDFDDWNYSPKTQLIEAWSALRNRPESRHIALAYPRFISRLPYSNKTTAVENFDYEEMPEMAHENYLWANSAYLVTLLLAESYDEFQWQFKPGQINEVEDMPTHIYNQDGDQEMKPCAEILLTERAGESLVANGITPVWSIRHRDNIRVGPFVSFNSTPQLIAGKWQG